jgi:GT2 family glycosyltransferase
MFDITASIVLYKNDRVELKKAIDSFLNTSLHVKLFLIDNSPTDKLKDISNDERIEYVFSNGNVGFGKAHNVALKKVLETSKYHLVLNPDISFPPSTLEEIMRFMDTSPEVGLVLPKVLFPGGELQRLCRLLPTPFDLFVRRFLKSFTKKVDYYYEMQFADYDSIFEAPFLSGCFMFLRSKILKDVGFFDENMFLYFEDLDFSRRIHAKYKTIYYPKVFIYHEYKRGAHNSLNLLFISVRSLFYYFSKWGWFDSDRKKINKRTLDKFPKSSKEYIQ